MNKIRLIIAAWISWIELRLNKVPYFPRWNRLTIKKNIHTAEDGKIIWRNGENYNNHIEMSGFLVSAIVSYAVDKKGCLKLFRHVAFPTLRYEPNKTRCNLRYNFGRRDDFVVKVKGRKVSEKPFEIVFDGRLIIKSNADDLVITREISPLKGKGGICEKVSIKGSEYEIDFNDFKKKSELDSKYTIEKRIIRKNENEFYQLYLGYENDFDITEDDLTKREEFIESIRELISLDTPDKSLNQAFNFAKLRVCESIFKTKNGLMHSPGGGSYYAAMWANDQCEYVNPLFPFIGYKIGNNQSINCYKMFSKYSPIPSSLISEGEKAFSVAGDRGDSAMYAYGAARFALAYGDIETTKILWKPIKRSVQYSLNNINEFGVVESDSDELENRFESGSANLFTSSLLYDALISCDYISKELSDNTFDYLKEAMKLKKSIENYFGKNIKGFETYQYYKGNEKLRAWICIPIVMGILERKDDTIKAMYSKCLWNNGLRTIENYDLIWDRATLYGLRAGFIADYTEVTLEKLKEYTDMQLLGSHMPYPTEAFPEGNRMQLSGESALYMRIFTEGLFGIRVTGHNTFVCNPKLPKTWDYMKLKNINLFGKKFDLIIRNEDDILLEIISERKFEIEEFNHSYQIKFI